MKKLGNGLSFLTKIMLVIGLLISNLSSLSMVFADEVAIDIKVEENKLEIEYLDELDDEVKNVKVKVYENYTFLDRELSLDEKVTSKDFSFVVEEELEDNENSLNEDVVATSSDEIETNLLVEDEVATPTDELEGSEVVATESDEINNDEVIDKKISLSIDSILEEVVFDGTYSVKVEIIDTTNAGNEVIDSRELEMEVLHESGVELALVDAVTGEDVKLLEDGRYVVSPSSSKVNVVARFLPGGLNPKDQFLYEDAEYIAEELVGVDYVVSELDYNGRLFGDYLEKEEVVFQKFNGEEYQNVEIPSEKLELNILYGTYDLNALTMNYVVENSEHDGAYMFDGETKDGIVYVLLEKDTNNTMLDLYNIANYAVDGQDIITFVLSNSQYEDVVASFDEETATVSLEEYLDGIKLDETAVLSLINEGLTITYKVVFAGDNNNDNILDKNDLLELIDQVVGFDELNLEKSDLYGEDGKVNLFDVMYLNQIIKNSSWDVSLTDEEVMIDTGMEVVEEDIVSGSKFTINYIVKLADYSINGLAGLFKYDDKALQLDEIKVYDEWFGNNKDGKFLYMSEKSLELPEVDNEVTDEDTDMSDEVQTEEVELTNEMDVLEDDEVVTEDYAVISAIFTALKSGTHTVAIEEREFFNDSVYYLMNEAEEEVSVSIIVKESNDNTLSSLVVGGQTITLVDGQFDYEITVSNDVTILDVEALTNNIAANITSMVCPEELVEGENIVTITVMSESGEEQVYTVKVTREKALEEENTNVNYNNSYNDYDDKGETDGGVVVTQPEDNEEEDDDKTTGEEDSSLSRIVIIILILLVIAGLIYLIFKDEDDEEVKKANKNINKLKKEDSEIVVEKVEKKNVNVENKKPSNSKNNSKNNDKNYNSNNKKKER